jgi:hypothetical protein
VGPPNREIGAENLTYDEQHEAEQAQTPSNPKASVENPPQHVAKFWILLASQARGQKAGERIERAHKVREI